MSASRCMHNARRIMDAPLDQWGAQIGQLPTVCPHTDCGEPKNCQLRLRDYLRMQYRLIKHHEARDARRGAKRL